MFIPGEGVFCNILVQMAKMPKEKDERWPFIEVEMIFSRLQDIRSQKPRTKE